MIYQYEVCFWKNPESGFELAEQHASVQKLKDVICMFFGRNSKMDSATQEFGKDHQGLVLDSAIIDTDKPFDENRTEIEEELQKKFPGAQITSVKIVNLIETPK